MQRIEKVVYLSYQEIPELKVIPNLILEDQVFKLGVVTSAYWQKTEELESNIIPHTPSEVLKEGGRVAQEYIR